MVNVNIWEGDGPKVALDGRCKYMGSDGPKVSLDGFCKYMGSDGPKLHLMVNVNIWEGDGPKVALGWMLGSSSVYLYVYRVRYVKKMDSVFLLLQTRRRNLSIEFPPLFMDNSMSQRRRRNNTSALRSRSYRCIRRSRLGLHRWTSNTRCNSIGDPSCCMSTISQSGCDGDRRLLSYRSRWV